MSRSAKKGAILIGTLVAVIVLVAGGLFLAKHLKKKQWIIQQVYTVSMDEARKRAYLGNLAAHTLLPGGKQEQAGNTLHNAILYPESHTVICTVDVPKDYAEFAVYLVSGDGQLYPGWYRKDLVQYDIAKVAFENLETIDLVYLDLVDQSKATALGGYDPADKAIPRIRYNLTPPAIELEESSSDASSS